MSAMPPPIFTFNTDHHAPSLPSPLSPPPSTTTTSQRYRPAVSSPLSLSSPVRPSQQHHQQTNRFRNGHSSPLSPCRQLPNVLSPAPRECQSSPISCGNSIFGNSSSSSSSNNQSSSSSRFASRQSKPNPLRQSRESRQEVRRKLFLDNVRQRADDKAWQRRGGDQEVNISKFDSYLLF
jgi:hypothetical protein